MHQVLEKLRQDHRNLGQVLRLLSTQLDHFFAGRESDFDLKIELLEYIETYADLGHHPLEDLLYQTARQRSTEGSELLDRLHTQHQKLIRSTRKFRLSLEGILHDGVMSRAELEVQGREYIALQRLHIDLEEQEAFPLLDRVLTDADWETICEHMPRHEDPVFGTPDQVRFRNLCEYLETVGRS